MYKKTISKIAKLRKVELAQSHHLSQSKSGSGRINPINQTSDCQQDHEEITQTLFFPKAGEFVCFNVLIFSTTFQIYNILFILDCPNPKEGFRLYNITLQLLRAEQKEGEAETKEQRWRPNLVGWLPRATRTERYLEGTICHRKTH